MHRTIPLVLGILLVPAPVARPDPGRVSALDARIQKQFGTIRKRDVEEGRFGTSRYAALGLRAHHGLVFRPENEEERAASARIEADGWLVSHHVIGAGKREDLMVGPITAEGRLWDQSRQRKAIAGLAAKAMAAKAPVEGTAQGDALEARPVLASDAKCLGCHAKKKVGDPLGAVVYSFRRDAR